MYLIRHQRGSFLLEALMAFVIFAVGILGLVGLQASSISVNVDTQYRVEANQLAHRMLATMQSSMNRTNATTFQTSLLAFDHRSTGDGCAFSGNVATDSQVAAWLAVMQTAGSATVLPAADGQIRVTLATPLASPPQPQPNHVRIVVCWQQPGLPVPRRHVVIGSIS